MKSSVTFVEKLRNGNTHYRIILSNSEHMDKVVTFYVSVTQRGKVHFIEVPEQDETEMRVEIEEEITH